jgi:hypothetical protein
MRDLMMREVVAVSGGEGDDGSTACNILGGLAGVATGLIVGGGASILSILTAGTTLPGAAILGTVSGLAAGGIVRNACLGDLDDGDDEDEDDED